MGNDDFVRVPREPTIEMCNLGAGVLAPHHAWRANYLCGDIYRAMLSAAPPSAPSGEPVAWLCKLEDGDFVTLEEPDYGSFPIVPLYAAPSGDNVSTLQSTGLSAIAQERDVVTVPVSDLWEIEKALSPFAATSESISEAESNLERDWPDEGPLKNAPYNSKLTVGNVRDAYYAHECIKALIATFTTSPKAISEAPISAEAVEKENG